MDRSAPACLQTEAMNLRRELESRVRQPLRDAREQVLTSQITNCVVKQNAAASVTHTYKKILAILRKVRLWMWDRTSDTAAIVFHRRAPCCGSGITRGGPGHSKRLWNLG